MQLNFLCKSLIAINNFCRESLKDLERALEYETRLPQAYWQRHLIWLVYGEHNLAMDDVNYLLKISPMDVAAYKFVNSQNIINPF